MRGRLGGVGFGCLFYANRIIGDWIWMRYASVVDPHVTEPLPVLPF